MKEPCREIIEADKVKIENELEKVLTTRLRYGLSPGLPGNRAICD